MIDLDKVRRAAREDARPCAGGKMGVVVSPEWLERVADELEAARGARPEQGTAH